MTYFSINIGLGDTEGSRALPVVNDVLSDLLAYYAPLTCNEILIAVHELIINSLYALRRSPGKSDREIQVTLFNMGSYIYAEVADPGEPIEKAIVAHYIDNTHESGNDETHGRGLAMIKMLSTAFGYYRTGKSNVFFAVFAKQNEEGVHGIE